MLLSRVIRLKPNGPMMAPAIIKPSRWGIFTRFSKMGANNMMSKITRNFNTGLDKGSVVSMAFKNDSIFFIFLCSNIEKWFWFYIVLLFQVYDKFHIFMRFRRNGSFTPWLQPGEQSYQKQKGH
jgi:hypothetical protein